jgi:hypothetical protein
MIIAEDPRTADEPARVATQVSAEIRTLGAIARLETWGMIAQIAAAVAVVVSVIYLGRQIHDNTKLLRTEAHFNALALAQRPLEMMVENESLAGIVAACDVAPREVEATAWGRCSNYYFMQFNAWEYMYYQNRDKSIPVQLWNGADAYFKAVIGTRPGYTRFWSETATAFDEPFRSYADQHFKAQN